MDNNISPMGVLCINKPCGITSHTVVNIVRKLYNTKQVGHTGTLDPLATGVLPIMVGRAVKASEYLTAEDKGYIAEMKLGVVTDSGDITGNIIRESKDIPSSSTVYSVAGSFTGNIKQTPPMYSALKVQGQKLVDLARKGIEVERQAREITINRLDMECTDENNGTYRLSVECSKGTYIRTLCTDIGEKLGCGATMTALQRTKSGNFTLVNSYTLEELEKMSLDERTKLLLPIESLFEELPKIALPAFFERLARSGLEIYIKKIGIAKEAYPLYSRFRLCGKDGFFALGELREYPDGYAVKPIKQFILD